MAINLEFGIDHHHEITFLKGHAETQVVLQCQRCMQPFTFAIVDDFLSGIVKTEEQAKLLPEQYEPLIVPDDNLVIRDVVEDELIISLPIVPLHDSTSCQVTMPFAVAGTEAVEVKRDSPFKVIELLKTKGKQEE